jgi:hypothetical protein
MPIIADYPPIADNRGPGFWANPKNLWAARRKFRVDQSNQWRDALHRGNPVDPSYSCAVDDLLSGNKQKYRFIVLADTGEGDKSQYGLLPLIRALQPDFMIINGDVAYPGGNVDDFLAGFFEPYRNLKIPIWATPGNHEYYSEQHGTEFYQTFCTWTWAERWSTFGLRLVPQPGMFWEIRDDAAKQVILGIDSGMSGNLDGSNDAGDIQQHNWLTSRLAMANTRQQNVIVMFHIPGLVNGSKADVHLTRLHQTLLMFPCVKLVLTGHEHSFQQYKPEVFWEYVYPGQSSNAAAPPFPHYMVAGGGGAYLSSTAWYDSSKRASLRYSCAPVCVSDWKEYRRTHRPTKVNFGHSVLSRLVSAINEEIIEDPDIPDMMSFVVVDVDRSGGPPSTTVSPVFQEDFEKLFSSQPPGTRINVQAGIPAPDPGEVTACLQQSVSW